MAAALEIRPFELHAREGHATHAEMAIALAAELRRVEPVEVDTLLCDLADEFATAFAGGGPDDDLVAAVGVVRGFDRTEQRLGTDDLCLDVVLRHRRGHPALVAVAVAEAARRCGSVLSIVGDAAEIHLAHPASEIGLVADVAAGHVRQPHSGEAGRLTWRCSHQWSFSVLRELAQRSLRSGDIGMALRAAELRLTLPVDAELREQLLLEQKTLLARLN